jgi:hypothetical protein
MQLAAEVPRGSSFDIALRQILYLESSRLTFSYSDLFRKDLHLGFASRICEKHCSVSDSAQ